MKSSNLHLNEKGADEEEVLANGQLQGYAPLFPIPIIIALSFSWIEWKPICLESMSVKDCRQRLPL